MNTEEIKIAIDNLIKLYKDIEDEYGVDMTYEVNRVKRIYDDIDDAIYKCEGKKKEN